MNRIAIPALLLLFLYQTAPAQPPKAFEYSVGQVLLPDEMNKQVCISGMKSYRNELYFASERCPYILVFNPEKKIISRRINIQVPKEYEMEGITSYKNKLYMITEDLVGVYEINPQDGALNTVTTSIPLPEKLKSGDGMEGIAAHEPTATFYLLRERNEDLSRAQIYTFRAKPSSESGSIKLEFENTIELPLENPQWRYSDICVDEKNNRLICLKSFSKGKLRQQFLESITIDASGKLQPGSLRTISVDRFTEVSNTYKAMDYSMNLEGITITENGTIYLVSDNTSGKALCDKPAREKTVLLELKKN